MTPNPTSGDLEYLRRLDACTLSNAIETFETRLRNEGFTRGSIRCLFPELPPMVGYAATVTIHGSNPPVGARTYLDRTDWWDYILSVPAPRVVVVQDLSKEPGLGSLLGEVHVSILQALDCAGAVTNGSVRDVPSVRRLSFPFFAAGMSVSHAYVHLVDIGVPVEVAGLKIRSGDLLHGDLHGVLAIPPAVVGKLPPVVSRMAAAEQAIIAACRSPSFTPEKLRVVLAERQS